MGIGSSLHAIDVGCSSCMESAAKLGFSVVVACSRVARLGDKERWLDDPRMKCQFQMIGCLRNVTCFYIRLERMHMATLRAAKWTNHSRVE